MKQKMKAILLSRVSTPGQDTEAQSNELIRAAEADGKVTKLVKKAYKNEVRYEDGRPYDLKVLELHKY